MFALPHARPRPGVQYLSLDIRWMAGIRLIKRYDDGYPSVLRSSVVAGDEGGLKATASRANEAPFAPMGKSLDKDLPRGRQGRGFMIAVATRWPIGSGAAFTAVTCSGAYSRGRRAERRDGSGKLIG